MRIRRTPHLVPARALIALVVAFAFALQVGARAPQNVSASKSKIASPVIVFDLSDFGAVGDGETDDGPALQAALDALADAGGGTLFVPGGHYRIATSVVKDFGGLTAPVVISGVESFTPVPPPTADGHDLSRGLDLVSEFLPGTGEQQVAIHLAGLRSLTINDIAFVGAADAENDALVTLSIESVEDATVRHCEFYGLSSLNEGGAILRGERSVLKVEQSAFLGCTTSSGVYGSVVDNIEWKGIEVSDTVFVDYGQRPELFSKTGLAAPFSWINVGNAAAVTNDSPRREAVVRNVFLDEGALFGIGSLPERYQPKSAPIDLLYVTGLWMNVSNLGTSGHFLDGPRGVLVENSHYGWSHNADSAIRVFGAQSVVLDRIECVASATTLRADAATARLTVIDSVYEMLDSQAQNTRVVVTTMPDEDPVQYVRTQFQSALSREPDAAAHLYWTEQILACGDDAQCVAARRDALAAYLAASPQPKFTLTGHVLDEQGEPLADAMVVLNGSQSVTTATDAAGFYRFSNLPTSGVYTVAAAKRHCIFDAVPQTVSTPAGDVSADFAGVLKRHSIGGRLATASGVGIAAATVELSGAAQAQATTDANGNFLFVDLPAGGDYTVTPSSARYTFGPETQTFGDLEGDAQAVFTGTPLFCTIHGRVVNINNGGLPGVVVKISGTQTRSTTTDASGNYSFADVARGGNYTVTPSLFGHTFSPASATFNNISTDQFAGFVGSGTNFKIVGRVTENGAGLAGATVAVTGSASASTTTDAQGNYTLSLPAAGDYTLAASKKHYAFAPAATTFTNLSGDQTVNLAATLDRHKISGRVARSNGSAMSGVVVTLAGMQSATATTDAAGNYSFTNLPAGGTYTVTPAKTGYDFSPAVKTLADLGPDQAANFTVSPASRTVGGRVREGVAGVAGVTVTLSGSRSATATTDANGNYSFTVNSEDSVTVTPSKAHYKFAPQSLSFNNPTSDQTADFDATLDRHNITGRVVDVNNNGIAGVAVALNGSQTSTATTDASGNFTFNNLPAGGNYTVTPSSARYTFGPSSLSFTDLGGDKSAAFTGTPLFYTISGRVVNINNGGLPGVVVKISGTQTRSTTTDASGNYSFADVARGGNYTVTPSLQFNAFTPTSQSFNDLGGDHFAGFVGGIAIHKIAGRVTEKGAGLAGVTVNLAGSHTQFGPQTGQTVTGADGSYSLNVVAGGDYTVTPSKKNYVFDRASASFAALDGERVADFAATQQPVVEFSAASFNASEDAGSFHITLTRGGDTSSAASVTYLAQNGTAEQGVDISTVVGRVRFAPGETTKTVTLFITDDAFIEGSESITLTMRPVGSTVVGPQATATFTINDNDSNTAATNPVEDARFFVRQHYRDFLNREPDQSGLDFWANQIAACGTDAACLALRRQNVSAAFFLSIEFKETGYLIHRLYKSAYGRAPRRVEEFLFDSRIIGAGIVVGETGWEQKLEANKQAFLAEFVAREAFRAKYPSTLTPAEFVAALNANTGGSLSTDEVSAAVAEFGGASVSADDAARQRALLRVAENRVFYERELNSAFVLMQYFGYLQRNPDDPPDDQNLVGYNFWLKKLNDFHGDFAKAEMVRAFIESIEYRGRFGK